MPDRMEMLREAATEALSLLHAAQMSAEGTRLTLHRTRAKIVADRLTAALGLTTPKDTRP